jgi:TfoX/Sxy family transcriptional regulator of competence genes
MVFAFETNPYYNEPYYVDFNIKSYELEIQPEDIQLQPKDKAMASKINFVDFVIEQIKNSGEITAKKMFGEYGIYSDGKLFGLICDDKLFIKPTNSGRKFIGNVVEAPPYEGAKPSFLIEDKIEDSEWLSELVKISLNELPAPKPKKKK